MSKWGIYYQKSKKSYVEFNDLDNNLRTKVQLDPETSRKLKIYLKMREKEEIIVKKSEKVCPICHMIKSLTGECLC